MPVSKAINSRVLQKAAYNAFRANIFGKLCDARFQTADSAHDKIDRYFMLACGIQGVDHIRVDERVQF